MSRRRNNNNNNNGDVRGPTSALTSFLKDQGIRSRNIRNGWSRREAGQDDAAPATPVAGPSTSGTTPGGTASPTGSPSFESPAPSAGPSTPAGLSSLAEEGEHGDGDDVDDDEEEDGGAEGVVSRGRSSSAPGTRAASEDIDNDEETTDGRIVVGEGSSSSSSRMMVASSSTSTRRRVSVRASTSRETVESRITSTSTTTTTTNTTTTTKRKAAVSAAAAAAAAQNAKKKQKKDHGSEDDDTDDADFSPRAAPKARYADRKPGSFAMCAECNKKFTITRYTNQHPSIPGGLLCGPCDKEIGPGMSGGGAGKSSASAVPSAAKKKARAVKGKTVLNKDKPQVTSLTKSCIELIGKAIDHVEELGDIGEANIDRVCQIVCKNRDLTMETVKLFLDVEHRSLKLYDCTRLEPEALQMLANHCPNLETLTLQQCGFMDDETILHYANRLKKLRHLELYAAFLVRKAAWGEFFDVLEKEKRGLDGFMVRLSARIDNSVISSLVKTSPNLTHLRLAEIGCLDDTSLALLHPLKHLEYLDLSHGGLDGKSFTDEGVIALLENVGTNLTTLILDDNTALTDRTLIEGVKVNCPNLTELSLKNLDDILPTGVAELFNEDWVNQKGMVRLNLHRCTQLDDQALEAVINHSGKSLTKLDLNSVDAITEKGLKCLANHCPNLVELDVSFVREVDDFLLKAMLDGLPALQKIYIYGDNRISDLCPTKMGVRILGHEQGVVTFD